jgi:hypothetical protein
MSQINEEDRMTTVTLTSRRLLFPPYPQLIEAAATQAKREAAYHAALTWADLVEPDPRSHRLTRHYETVAGDKLETLDEVVRALIDGDLA